MLLDYFIYWPMPVVWTCIIAFVFFKNNIRKAIIYISLAILIFTSFQLLPELLKIPLSKGTANLMEENSPSAVIVLTGGIYFDGHKNWYPSPESIKRTAHGIYISDKYNIPLILMGGSVEKNTPSESNIIKEFFLLENAIIENKSRNTAQAADNLKNILKTHGISEDLPLILCTSKTHFLRAFLSFRSLGYKIISPLNTDKFKLKISHFIPNYKAIVSLNVIIKEYIGIAWYIFNGNIRLVRY